MSWVLQIGIDVDCVGFAVEGHSGNQPLSAPRRLRYTEDDNAPDGGVTFDWLQPASWGSTGPHGTNRYEYSTRDTVVGGAAIESRPWSGGTLYNSNSVRIAWARLANAEILQFRVRAIAAGGHQSDWVESPALTEDAVNPPMRGGPFSREFSRRFEGGGA